MNTVFKGSGVMGYPLVGHLQTARHSVRMLQHRQYCARNTQFRPYSAI